MRIFLSIFIVLLWSFNTDICDFVFNENTKEINKLWWKLRMNIYAVIVALSFQLALIKERNKIIRLVLNIGTGLAFSNVVDRWLFDVREYRKEDLLMVAITISYAIYDYKCLKKN